MAASRCQRCSQLPPPPPIFSLEPPPNLLSIDLHCTSRFEHKKILSSSSSSITSHLTIVFSLCIIIFISIGAILFIKNRLIKRKSNRQRHSLSVNFNHHHPDHWMKTMPLLSDSSCSDQMSNTPMNDYRFGIVDDIHHDYEQISYCLIYCRQCENYHQTSCTCH